MTNTKDKKNPIDPQDEKNPLLEAENNGSASGVSQEIFEAIVSNRLEIAPPDLSSSTSSEKQDNPNPSRQDDADSEDEQWFRIFLNQQLDIDPPSPVPFKLAETPSHTNDVIHSGDLNHDGGNSKGRQISRPLGKERKYFLASLDNTENVDRKTNQSALKDTYINELSSSKRSEPKGNGQTNASQMDLILGIETEADILAENEIRSSNEGKPVNLLQPEIKSKRNKGSILALTITCILVASTVGGWNLRNLNWGFSSRIDHAAVFLQSNLTDIHSLVEDHVLSPDDMVDSPQVKSLANSQRGIIVPNNYDYSILTQIQKDRLYKASLIHLADSEEEAVYKAQSIGYLPKGGHPATMCGPLTISILRDALLLDRYVDLENFWLLNPRDDYTVRAIIERYFPREHYFWFQTSTPINHFDFLSYPLYTGDFLYLFAGQGGNFEHMLLVTRIDEAGRVYSVTPLETANGYSIKEVMLYDPNHPGEGYFYDITNKTNAEFGLTGMGGFRMWRRITPIPEINLDDLAFSRELDAILDEVGGDWHVYIKGVGDRVIYSRKADEIIHPASVIKVPLAIQFFQALDYQDDDIREYLSERGVGGRTYRQLLQAMLVVSEEKATLILENWVNDRLEVKDVFANWGVQETSFSPRRSTAEEMGWIFEGLYRREWIGSQEREIILELLSEITSNDDTRLGVIRDNLNGDDKFFNKRGSLLGGRTSAADVAVVEIGDVAYVISLFGYPGNEEKAPTYDDLEAAIEDAAPVIWEYLSQQ